MKRGIEALVGPADALGLQLASDQWERLRELRGLWALYARSMNLVGPGQLDAQMVESLMLVSALRRWDGPRDGGWVDVGSGGGFPGLVLAACQRGEGLLIEPREKRSTFLELALGRLGLDGWGVVRGHVLAGGVREVEGDAVHPVESYVRSVAGCSARAVWDRDQWLRMAAQFLPADGRERVVSVHGHRGSSEPWRLRARVTVDLEAWSVRLYALEDVRRGFT